MYFVEPDWGSSRSGLLVNGFGKEKVMLGSRRFSGLLFVIFCGLPPVSWAQEGVVLDARQEGIVVDVGQMPNVQQGAKLGFVRLEGVRKEIGQGTVLDV